MRGFFVLALFFSSLGAFEGLQLETGAADYRGRVLYLSEGVNIIHPIGKLTADQMTLKPMEGVTPIQLGLAELNQNVRLNLTEGGQLTCSSALIDFIKGQGIFQNSPQSEYVIFSQNLKDKQGRLPFIVKARDMELSFDPSAPKPTIQKIAIHKDVQIDYNHDFIAAGDEGLFTRTEPSQVGLNGQIVLQSEHGKLCSVTNRNGDLIRSPLITIDTDARTIHFDKSTGSLNTDRSKLGPKIDFSAEEVLWNDQASSVLLQRNVSLQQKGMGKLTTDGDLKITQQVHQNKKQLATIESTGKTVLTQDSNTAALRTLTCYGKLLVDHVCSTITMEAPPEGDQQVFLEDSRGHVYANKATIYYNAEKSVQKVLLEGDVRVQNAQAEKPQYALADSLEYLPATQEMTLRANAKKRVILYDQAKDLQISAPGIVLKRELATGKENIKGLGDVRFSLAKGELDQLRQKFSLKQKFSSKSEEPE